MNNPLKPFLFLCALLFASAQANCLPDPIPPVYNSAVYASYHQVLQDSASYRALRADASAALPADFIGRVEDATLSFFSMAKDQQLQFINRLLRCLREEGRLSQQESRGLSMIMEALLQGKLSDARQALAGLEQRVSTELGDVITQELKAVFEDDSGEAQAQRSAAGSIGKGVGLIVGGTLRAITDAVGTAAKAGATVAKAITDTLVDGAQGFAEGLEEGLGDDSGSGGGGSDGGGD